MTKLRVTETERATEMNVKMEINELTASNIRYTYQLLYSVCDSLHSLRSVHNEIPIHMHMPEVKYVHELHTE